MLLECCPIRKGERFRGENFTLKVGQKGSMQIDVGKDFYIVESSFSHPGERMGINSLSERETESEPYWKPKVRKIDRNEIEVQAQGRFYTLSRRVVLEKTRIKVEDTLTNLRGVPTGIMVQNQIIAPRAFKEAFLGGAKESEVKMSAENPTIFIAQEKSSLGLIAKDNILRLQFEANSLTNHVNFAVRHFALDANKSYTLEWAIHPFDKASDYFTFVNKVRTDWNTNFTIEGPFDFFDARNPLLSDLSRLKAYLKRKNLTIVMLTPWLDYFDGAGITRPQYKEMMQKAIKTLKKVDPAIKCIGAVENNIVSFDRSKIKGNELLDEVCKGSGKYPIALSAEQTKVLEENLPWKDSFTRTPDGKVMIEDCKPTSHVHPIVYSEEGNYQAEYLMGQIKFLIDEVGMDGVYIDQFNLAFEKRQRYHYGKWDGYTVDIDGKTGEIESMYTDAALVGAKVREKLCKYVLSKGKVFVANTHSAVKETQSLPVFRFMEAEWSFDALSVKEGEEPPSLFRLCKGHLGSPIGLGYRPSRLGDRGIQNYAEVIIKSIIVYLRHGLLYYHYVTDIPETGPGSGEYGPINHMFSITPIELHKGWILGKERIISAVSFETFWERESQPKGYFFDLTGREINATGRYHFRREAGKWHIRLDLKDWKEIAVVE